MTRVERRVRRALVIGACVAAAMTMSTAVSAHADDGIARPPGAIDNRGYELVSRSTSIVTQVRFGIPAPNGDATVVYDYYGSAPGSSSGYSANFRATRTGAGWVSTSILPSRSELFHPNYFVTTGTPDLSTVIASSVEGYSTSGDSGDLFLAKLAGAGEQSLLQAFPRYFGPAGAAVAASDDLSNVLVHTPVPNDGSHLPGTWNVYDVGSGTPVLVSRMPVTGVAPVCGTANSSDSGDWPDGFAREINSAAQHFVSTDGRRAFFLSRGDTCTDPIELYMRDLEEETTTLVSGPPVGVDTANGVDAFLGATRNGSQVFYRTATSLVDSDDDDASSTDLDIYRWTAATGKNVCLTCGVVTNLDGWSGFNANAIVSEDGSHVYFTSPDRLADAPAPGTLYGSNVYVWRLGHGTIRYVAPASGLAQTTAYGTDVTPDGKTLIFWSNQPALDTITGRPNNLTLQYYRYDDRDGSVTCISCPEDGPTTSSGFLADVALAVRPDVRAMSDDGSMAFFTVFDPLVPEDTNNSYDIYEWHDGTVKLITDGRHPVPEDAAPLMLGVSADGRDAYFTASSKLTFDAQGGSRKVYDARIDGGFAPPPPAPADCDGDACQGGVGAPPVLGDVGTASARGAGNVSDDDVDGSFTLGSVTRRMRAKLARTGRLTITADLNKPGRLIAIARAKLGGRVRIVGRASAEIDAAGASRLRIVLSKRARAQLATRGRLTVTVTVDFSAAVEEKRVVLKLRSPGGTASRAAQHADHRPTADGR